MASRQCCGDSSGIGMASAPLAGSVLLKVTSSLYTHTIIDSVHDRCMCC